MIHVLVGPTISAKLIAQLVQGEQEAGDLKIHCDHPRSSLLASGKTLLVIGQQSVALVLDADSTNPEVAERTRHDAEEVIGGYSDSPRLRILVAVPTLESLLFQRPDAVRRAFPETPDNLIEIGLISPRDALHRLPGATDRPSASLAILAQLNHDDITALRTQFPMRELLEFCDECKFREANADVTMKL